MSVSSAPDPRSAIVTRLRAAGCVFAEDEARLLIAAARTPADLDAMVDRRAAGLPLEQVVGWAEFCGLRVAVDPGVFVPRRRTEFLVRQAVRLARQAGAGQTAAAAREAAAREAAAREAAAREAAARQAAARSPAAAQGTVVVDLCCGSGAVGAALAAALDGADVHAADIEPAAVRCARRNLAAAGAQVYQGDLYQPLPAGLRGRVGILTANVPYVPTGEVGSLPPEARMHEPLVALDGGADGLDVLRRVAAGAPLWLAAGGWLLIETSERQAPQAAAAFASSGLVPLVLSSAELHATVIIGTRPAAGH
jgi:release factor glutamine methyltransferase